MKTAYALALLLVSACSSSSPTSEASIPSVATPHGTAHRLVRRTATSTPASSNVASSNVASSTVAYYGGPVISNAKVYVVWWGPPQNLNADLTKKTGGIADFFAGVLDSAFADSLAQYSTKIDAQAGSKQGKPGTQQTIGHGTYAGTFTLSSIPAGDVTDAQIQSTIDAAISSGALPQPDADTLYALFFPSSVSITLDGDPSCYLWGAYHDQTTTTHHVAYAVVPDCGYAFDDFTNVTSHELAESITDPIPTEGTNPDYPQAWNDSGGNEVGDLCEGSQGTIATAQGTFTVQAIWDNKSQSCQVAK